MALLVVALEFLCCLGLGAVALRFLKIGDVMRPGEPFFFAFAIGLGLLGWLVFPLGVWGLLDSGWLLGLLVVGASGVVLLRPVHFPRLPERIGGVGWCLLALAGAAFIFDLAEALSPVADADTLAYHFNAPKLFLNAGRIEFILRPLDGATAYLLQMTYLPVLALGGERALLLWTLVSGWTAAAMFFVLCLRHLDWHWSLALALILVTLPAFIYSGGTGQVEIRLALFVMVAAWAVSQSLETGRLSFALLAGLAVGFYGGAKYIGLLFAFVCGLTILAQRRWLSHGSVFSLVAVAVGGQWYIWNALHTGDPFFPVLFQWIGRDDLILWTKEHHLNYIDAILRMDHIVPRSPLWLFLFPFKVSFDPLPALEAKRAGFGPYGILVLPFAVLGAWRFRGRIRRSPLLAYAAIAFIFYVLWFFSGPSQRIRHLSPVMPLFLLCVTVAAERLAAGGLLRLPLAAVLAATVVFQVSGHALFSMKYLRYIATGEDRASFLERNVFGYAPAAWVNANLSKDDLLFHKERQLYYYLDVPYFFGAGHSQAAISMNPEQKDAKRLYGQFKSVGITHLLINRDSDPRGVHYPPPMELLNEAGCFQLLQSFETRRLLSRTLPGLLSSSYILDVLKLKDASCVK